MKNLLTVLFLTLSVGAYAQSKTADEIAVEKQIDALIASWNNHDYSTMAAYATEDADWVNIVGMWWKNRKEVQFAHQAYHEVMFKNVTLTKNSAHLRQITPDVIIAHLNTKVGAFTTPGGHQKPEADNMSLLVFVKKGRKWLLTAGENVEIVDDAKKHDPVNNMPR
jgi:uncharacterized protein (TIGR02246 family)